MILTKIGKKTEHDTKGQDNDPGLGIRSSVFWANHSFFAKKWVKNEQISNLLTPLIFGEQPELFTHIAH